MDTPEMRLARRAMAEAKNVVRIANERYKAERAKTAVSWKISPAEKKALATLLRAQKIVTKITAIMNTLYARAPRRRHAWENAKSLSFEEVERILETHAHSLTRDQKHIVLMKARIPNRNKNVEEAEWATLFALERNGAFR